MDRDGKVILRGASMFIVGGTYLGSHGMVMGFMLNFVWLHFTYPVRREGEMERVSDQFLERSEGRALREVLRNPKTVEALVDLLEVDMRL